MKLSRKSLTALLLAIILCSFTPKRQCNRTSNSESNSVLKKFAPIINGAWVASDYIEDLKKTKSPRATINNIGGRETGMAIASKCISGDSLLFWYEDETNPELYILLFKKGRMKNSVEIKDAFGIGKDTSYRCLGYEITPTDTVLIVYTYTYNRVTKVKQMLTRKYQRAYDIWGDLNYKMQLSGFDDSLPVPSNGVYYFINKLLLSGKYSFTDSLGNKHIAEFNDFGKVTGIKDFKKYYAEYIFSGTDIDTDMIYLISNKDHYTRYKFHINKDTLLLDLDNNTEDIHPDRTYKLIRQN